MSRNLRALLDERIRAAMAAAGVSDAVAVITPAARPEFGDYQANGVMQAAKRIARNPRELAAAVVAKLDLDGIAEHVEIAGPGFINIRLSDALLADAANPATPLLSAVATPKTMVVDYSAPESREGNARRPFAQHHHRRRRGARAERLRAIA